MSGKTTKDHQLIPTEWLNLECIIRDMTEQEFCDASKQFAQKYAVLKLPENDDPLDDFLRIMRAALSARKEIGAPLGESRLLELSKRPRKENSASNLEDMLGHFSKLIHEIAPVLTIEQWRKVLFDLFSAKYGGTKVRIKKRPANKKKAAAKGLTINEIQEKLSVSRTYAYKLYREINKTAKK